jgi:hypothetical protein
METTEMHEESGPQAEVRRLHEFADAAAAALEGYGVLYITNIEVNRLVGRLSHRQPPVVLPDEDLDRLLGLSFAIEAAQAHAIDAHRSLRYLVKHVPELGALVRKLEELLSSGTSKTNDAPIEL